MQHIGIKGPLSMTYLSYKEKQNIIVACWRHRRAIKPINSQT